MEYITVRMTKELYDQLPDLHGEFEVKIIEVKDELFINDEIHKSLKKESDKAFKKLKDYEFRIRHNIK